MVWGQTLGSGPGASVFGASPFKAATKRWETAEQRRQAEQQAKIAADQQAHPTLSAALSGGGYPAGPQIGGSLPPSVTGSAPTPLPWKVGAVVDRSPPPDLDITHRGTGEEAYREHGNEFFTPGADENWYRDHGNEFAAPSAGELVFQQRQASGPMGNNALNEYRNLKRPNIATEPGYGSYYDNAQKNTVNALNTQLGARGAYGSSVGLGQIGKSISDLRADQARTEADYNLARLGEQRNWATLGGTLARNADLSSQGNEEVMGSLARSADTGKGDRLRDWRTSAENAEDSRISRLTGGHVAALGAQGAHDAREAQAWQQQTEMTGAQQELLQNAITKALAGDMTLLDAMLTGKLGGAREDANQESQNSLMNQVAQVVGMYKTLMGGGGSEK